MFEDEIKYRALWEEDEYEGEIVIEDLSPKLNLFAKIYYPRLAKLLAEDQESEVSNAEKDKNQTSLIKQGFSPRASITEEEYILYHSFAKSLATLLNDPHQANRVSAAASEWKYLPEECNSDFFPGFSAYRPVGLRLERFATVYIMVSDEELEKDDDPQSDLLADDPRYAVLENVMPKLMRTMSYLDKLSSQQTLADEYARPFTEEPPPRRPLRSRRVDPADPASAPP